MYIYIRTHIFIPNIYKVKVHESTTKNISGHGCEVDHKHCGPKFSAVKTAQLSGIPLIPSS